MKYVKNLLLRLSLALLFVVFYPLLDKILTPLTIYPSYFILRFFYDLRLFENTIILDNIVINFIPACIATIAYALLFLLIIFTKEIDLKKGVKMFLLGSLLILAINIFRIVFLTSIIIEYGTNLFDSLHLIFWNFISGVYIAFIWIYLVKRYKIKDIPIYSDIQELYKRINPKRRKRNKNSRSNNS